MTIAPTDLGFGADPSATYNSGITSALNSSNAFQNIAGQLGGGAEIQAGLGQEQIGAAESQYNLNNQAQNLSNQYNQSLAGYQLSQLGISNQQLGLQGTGLQEQQQLLGTQSGIEQQEYGIQQSQFPIEQQQLVGGLAASGALNTKGSQEQQTELSQAQQLSQRGQLSTVAGQQYSAEELANAQSNLGLLAKSNGMSQQEVINQLAEITASNQIQGAENPISLLNTIAQVNAGDISGIEQQISPLGFASGLNLFPGQP